MEKKSKKTTNGKSPGKGVGDLSTGMWSVVSFAKWEAKGLTYPQATERLLELQALKTPGLCIITDSAAARLKK